MSPAPQLQARLKPYKPAEGCVRRSAMIQSLGYRHFEQNEHGNKVYDVTPTEAAVLRRETQRPDDPKCVTPAFDILPAEQMGQMIKREQRARLGLSESDLALIQSPDVAQDPRAGEFVSREEMREVAGLDEAPAPAATAAPAPKPAASPRPKKPGGSAGARP